MDVITPRHVIEAIERYRQVPSRFADPALLPLISTRKRVSPAYAESSF
jgi:hypothetical protein